MTHEFGAPWGKLLIGMTAFLMIILVGIPIFATARGLPVERALFISGGPILIYLGAALFTIRGYKIANGVLYIKRLFWFNKIDLTRLRAVKVDPDAMSKSIRTFGNGGLFSFSGRFRNPELGAYRAFAMDPKKSVVLIFSDQTIVVTPDRPEEFAGVIKSVTSVE